MANPFGAAQGRTGFVSHVDSARIATFLRGVYWWMFGGLAVAAVVALAVASSPAAVSTLVGNKVLLGERIARVLPVRLVHRIAAAIFAILGLLTLLGAGRRFGF